MGRWKRTGRGLGEGGQAQVHVVTDSTGVLSGEYAEKVLKNSDRAGRLDLELSTMKSLVRTGASIIPIVDDYTVSDPDAIRPWYVMPIANGGSLSKAFSDGECYGGEEAKALALFREIVAAVQSVHAAGVAHRDLKPANILRHDDRVLLCDLGLCLPLDGSVPAERLTGELERIGSVHYTPREAFGRMALDRAQLALDAYALGKILYEVLAGRVLPGFTSHLDPGYDLRVLRGKPVYSGVNALLHALLSDRLADRLGLLEHLPVRVDNLIKWASETSGDEDSSKFREGLARGGEALARVLSAGATNSSAAQLDQRPSAATKEIYAKWSQSPILQQIESDLISLHANVLGLQRAETGLRMRDLVSAPYSKTHWGLEPIEEKGYPHRCTNESGCAIGMVPKEAAVGKLGQVWLTCLACTVDSRLHIALALAKIDGKQGGYSDIIRASVRVFSGSPDDPALLKNALDSAGELLTLFTTRLISDLEALR